MSERLSQYQIVEISKAKEILGENNVFGADEWKKFLGEIVQFPYIPEIPWSEDELSKPGVKQKHFLFLGLDRFDGKKVNVPTLCKYFSHKDHPKFYFPLLGEDARDPKEAYGFDDETCQLRWYFMPVGMVKNLICQYNSQPKAFNVKYEVPTVTERVTANILYYLLHKKYLDVNFQARTSSRMPYIMYGRPLGPLTVRGEHDRGIVISARGPYDPFLINVSASFRNLNFEKEKERSKEEETQREEKARTDYLTRNK